MKEFKILHGLRVSTDEALDDDVIVSVDEGCDDMLEIVLIVLSTSLAALAERYIAISDGAKRCRFVV